MNTNTTKKNKNYAIIQLDNRPCNLTKYWTLGHCINKYYASFHNYEYIGYFHRNISCKNFYNRKLFPAWCKVLLMKYALDIGYEKILFLDSDAYINNFSISIDDFIEYVHNNNKLINYDLSVFNGSRKNISIYVPIDCSYRRYFANTGIVLIINNNYTANIINAWYKSSLTNWKWDWDQKGFRYMVRTKGWFRKNIIRIHVGFDTWNVCKCASRDFDGIYWINHLSGPSLGRCRHEIADYVQHKNLTCDSDCMKYD